MIPHLCGQAGGRAGGHLSADVASHFYVRCKMGPFSSHVGERAGMGMDCSSDVLLKGCVNPTPSFLLPPARENTTYEPYIDKIYAL